MRCVLIIVLAFTLPALTLCQAEEVFFGRVVSVNRDNGRIVIKPAAPRQPAQKTQDIITLLPPGPAPDDTTAADVTVEADSVFLPRGIQPGRMIRVWGTFTRDRKVFNADRVLCEGCRNGSHDATGVRRRLWKSRKHRGQARGRHHDDH